MLNEDQVQDLLERCEASLGHSLGGVRAGLGTRQNRAPAIWELLVLDAMLQLGHVEYERPIAGPGSTRPDFRLTLGEPRGIWVDATYLTERFVDNQRRADLLRRRFAKEGAVHGVPGACLWSRLDGERTPAGFRRKLPAEHELSRFFKDNRVRAFFEALQANPTAPSTCDMRPDYTVLLGYDPTGRTLNSGLVEDAPRAIPEHGVYRKLEEKADQHRDVPGPYVVCLGSDRSPTVGQLRAPGSISEQQAVAAAFTKWPRLSAASLVSIEAHAIPLTGFIYSARSRLYVNERAHNPLTSTEIVALNTLDFNRWRYSRPHDASKGVSEDPSPRRHSGGSLVYKPLQNGNVEIEVPAWLLLKALGGPSNVIETYNLTDDDSVRRVLMCDWKIVNVRMVPGDIAGGEPTRVVLELQPDIRLFRT